MIPIQDIKDSTFDATIKSTLPVLVDFWAPWCGPCRMFSPIIDEIAIAYAGRVIVCKMDIDQNPETPIKYDIKTIPTIIIFKNGQQVEKLIGSQSRATLQNKLDLLL